MVPLISVSLFFSSIFQHGNSSGSGLDGIGTLNVTKSFRFSFTLALCSEAEKQPRRCYPITTPSNEHSPCQNDGWELRGENLQVLC